METLHHLISDHTKDIIALLVVVTFCVALFMPEHVISQSLLQFFGQIVTSVIAYYFAAKTVERNTKNLGGGS